MSDGSGCPDSAYRAGDEAHGFKITQVTPVPEIRASAVEATHLATGLQVLHLRCADRENLFALAFRTPPPDSTGVAHILEHSVLAGSEHYPVRDAFNELGRGSLKTFLNAFTAPDFTCYPVASQVRADFYNLASVYTDLVFRPLLAQNTFRREGHHLEVDEEGRLRISGIVYNEMKGAYSTAETVSDRTSMQSLFPDTPYGVESGGHPEQIPNLTYEAFRRFHHAYYSPSNARAFFYGDIPTPDHLAFLGRALSSFSRVEVDSAVPLQPRWTAPRSITKEYPIGADDPLTRRAVVNVAWMTAEMADLEERLILEVLEQALVGNAAAPLRKALIDSGLGEDLAPSTGLHAWYRQIPFVVGLRGTEASSADEIERLTLETLKTIAREGLSRELLEGAFHQVEFRGLEITRSSLPFALLLLFRSLGSWLHGLSPIPPLRFPTLMAGLRERWVAEPDLFDRAVRRWLVDNPHRVRAVVVPSRTLAAETEARLDARLAQRRAAMTEAEVEEIRASVEALRAAQRTKESPEALATLPVLKIEDIPREVETIPTAERRLGGVLVLEHDLFTNGIAYAEIAFDVSDVPEEQQILLPLLGAAAAGMGAGGLDYEAFATRKALVTGGVEVELKSRDRVRGDGAVQLLVLRARALKRNVAGMAEVLNQILVSGDLTDADRLRDILSEQRNEMRAMVAPRGSNFAWTSAAAGLSLASYRDEQWHGATQIRYSSNLARRYEEDGAGIRAELARLRERVFRRGRAIVNLTGDSGSLMALRGPIEQLIGAFPDGGEVRNPGRPNLPRGNVGVSIPGEVCYVGRVFPVPSHNDPVAPLIHLIASHLHDGVVYQKVRVEGGAYGGYSLYNAFSGQMAFLSYRDPNLEKTLQVYDEALDLTLAEGFDDEAVRKMVISTIAALDRPLDPVTRGYVALERMLSGLTDADRQRYREALLAADPAAIRETLARVVIPAMGAAIQSVYAPRQRIEEVNVRLAEPFEISGLE